MKGHVGESDTIDVSASAFQIRSVGREHPRALPLALHVAVGPSRFIRFGVFLIPRHKAPDTNHALARARPGRFEDSPKGIQVGAGRLVGVVDGHLRLIGTGLSGERGDVKHEAPVLDHIIPFKSVGSFAGHLLLLIERDRPAILEVRQQGRVGLAGVEVLLFGPDDSVVLTRAGRGSIRVWYGLGAFHELVHQRFLDRDAGGDLLLNAAAIPDHDQVLHAGDGGGDIEGGRHVGIPQHRPGDVSGEGIQKPLQAIDFDDLPICQPAVGLLSIAETVQPEAVEAAPRHVLSVVDQVQARLLLVDNALQGGGEHEQVIVRDQFVPVFTLRMRSEANAPLTGIAENTAIFVVIQVIVVQVTHIDRGGILDR